MQEHDDHAKIDSHPTDAYLPATPLPISPTEELPKVTKPEQHGHSWRHQIVASRLVLVFMALTVLFGSAILYLVASVVSVVIAIGLIGDGISPSDPEFLVEISRSPLGLVLTILPPQLCLLVLPIVIGLLFPDRLARTLRLVRGDWPYWGWIAGVAATPLVGMISAILISLFFEESDQLKQLTEIFRMQGQAGFLIPVILLIGLTPAVCEEVLFRGFLQPRLVRISNPAIGIFLASFFFALFHVDPVHVLAVFPLGVWLGILSYKSGSLIPAMLAHFFNNALSVYFSATSEEGGSLDSPGGIQDLILFIVGIIGFFGVAYLVWYRPAAIPQHSTMVADSE